VTAPGGPVPVLVGPTASGKTACALAVAEALDAEIVNVDSRQIYRGMAIGSAAPTAGERMRVPHHLVGIADPGARVGAGEFGRMAAAAMASIRSRGRTPLLTGGSGLYLRAALGGLDRLPRDETVRDTLRARLGDEGIEALHAELARRDPATAARVAPRDTHRVLRALELLLITGKPASTLRRLGRATLVPARIVVLDRPRGELERRIRARTAAMIEAGLRDEVEALLDAGVDPAAPAMKSVGYAETVSLVRGKLDRAAWEEAIVIHTRRYAKRQRTWFRGIPEAVWVVAAGDEAPAVTAGRLRKGLESRGGKP
jgi:tRNA dimethylallyltransferase